MSSYVSLAFHKACPPQDSDQGHKCPQLTLIPTQISQTNMWTNQISAIDIGPRIIRPSHLRIYMLRHRNYPQPTSVFSTRCRVSSISTRDQLPYLPYAKSSPTSPTDAVAKRIICNRCRGSLKYFQLTPGLSKR